VTACRVASELTKEQDVRKAAEQTIEDYEQEVASLQAQLEAANIKAAETAASHRASVIDITAESQAQVRLCAFVLVCICASALKLAAALVLK